MIKYCSFFIVLILSCVSLRAQAKDYELGADVLGMRTGQQGGYFNYSDPEAVNIKVSVWGWVRYPGKYTIPSYSTMSDLISYSGGPMEGASLEDLRVYRVLEDSSQTILKFSYDDLLYEGNFQVKNRKVPKLEAGDILVVPGEPRLYFRDRFAIWLSVLSVLTSLTILVFNIVKK